MAERTQAELAWLEAYNKFLNCQRWDVTREIIVTPYDGHYGRAGLVITVNGSPPHATMLVKSYDAARAPQVMYVLHGYDSPRRLKSPDNYLNFTKSRAVVLWRATVALLIELGYLTSGAVR